MAKIIPSETSKLTSKNSNPQALRVLIVEDSESDALLIIRELKKGGYNPVHERVETAAVMKKALQEKQWDIILCDYKLPEFNAPSAIAVLKEINIDIPLIIVSGAIGEETAVKCMRLGANDYLMKSHLSRLVPAIERELKEAKSRIKNRQVKETLRESEERFRKLADAGWEGIVFHKDGILIDGNNSFLTMFGYSSEEIIGKSVLNFLAPESIDLAVQKLKQYSLGGESYFEAKGLKKDKI